MENTYTLEEDGDMHISYPSESLCKRQFVIHIIINTGEAENKMGYTTLVCEDSPNDKVPIIFQKNAWISTEAIIEIAK